MHNGGRRGWSSAQTRGGGVVQTPDKKEGSRGDGEYRKDKGEKGRCR